MSDNPPSYPPGAGQPYGPPAGGPVGGYPVGQPGQPQYGQPAYGSPYGPPGQAGFGTPPAAQRGKRWYQRWWVWLIVVIALLIIAGIAYGVGHVSKYQLQDKVKEAFKNQNITVTDVKCPDSVSTDKGTTTSCTGVIEGATRTIDIRFDSDRHFLVTAVK